MAFCLILLLTILEELFINVVIINCHQNALQGTQESSKQSLVLRRTILHANQYLKNLTSSLNFYRGGLWRWKFYLSQHIWFPIVFLYKFQWKVKWMCLVRHYTQCSLTVLLWHTFFFFFTSSLSEKVGKTYKGNTKIHRNILLNITQRI